MGDCARDLWEDELHGCADDSGDDAVQQQACAADDELDEKNEIEEAVSRHLLTTTPSRESALRAAVMRVRAALGRG